MWNKLNALHHHVISCLTFDKLSGKTFLEVDDPRKSDVMERRDVRRSGAGGRRNKPSLVSTTSASMHACISHDGSSVDVWVVMWLAVALDEQVVACATRGCTCKWMTECWLVLLNTSAQLISLCDFYYSCGFVSKSNHVIKVFQEK